MSFLIDSDWLIDYLEDKPEAYRLFASLREEELSISAITYMETFEGIERRDPGAEQRRDLQDGLDALPVLDVSRSIARRCAELRVALRQRGRGVTRRSLDLLIAATAIEYGLTLVTRNREDYADIADLRLYEST